MKLKSLRITNSSLRIIPAVLANLSAALAEILLMASSAWLIASAALHPPLSSLSIGITLVRAAGIFRAALRYADRFFSHKIIFKFLDELRGKIFIDAASKLPLKSGRSSEGDLLHKLTVEADTAKDFLPQTVLPISTAALVTLLLTFFLASTIKFYALILPLNFLAVLILSVKFKSIEPDDSAYREKILDLYDGRDELKIFGTTPAVERLNCAAKIFGAEHFKAKARDINFGTLINILNAACTCAILYQVSLHVDRISLTVLALVLISFQLSAFRFQPLNFRFQNSTFKEKSLCITNYALRINNVTFGYNPAQIVLKDFNLEVQRGEQLIIRGESGAGKTTLLYLMTKLFQPDKGSVEIYGKVAAATSTNYIFSESIRANFEMLHENISDEEILTALKICQLESFDIYAPIGEDAANLSGGERVRLQIALAIAKNPDVLILDEPTAGLNKNLAEKLIAAVAADCKKNNRTLIILTHDVRNFYQPQKVIDLSKN